MPGFLASPSPISTSGWAVNTWETVNCTGVVPSGSSAAIILVTTNTTNTTVANLGVRKSGVASPDVWAQSSGGPAGNTVSAGNMYLHAPLNSSLQFDIYTSAFVNVTFQVVGYWSSTEATFYDNAINTGIAPGSSTYNSPAINATTAGVPSSALAVFIGINSTAGGQFGVRPVGDTDAYYGAVSGGTGHYGQAFTALSSGQFQVRTATGAGTVWIMGHLNSGTNFLWNTNAINVTPASAGSLQPLTQESNATAYLYFLTGPSSTAAGTSVIEGTATTGITAACTAMGQSGQVWCGPNSQANLSTLTSMAIYELAYFYSSGGGGGTALGMMMGVGK